MIVDGTSSGGGLPSSFDHSWLGLCSPLEGPFVPYGRFIELTSDMEPPTKIHQERSKQMPRNKEALKVDSARKENGMESESRAGKTKTKAESSGISRRTARGNRSGSRADTDPAAETQGREPNAGNTNGGGGRNKRTINAVSSRGSSSGTRKAAQRDDSGRKRTSARSATATSRKNSHIKETAQPRAGARASARSGSTTGGGSSLLSGGESTSGGKKKGNRTGSRSAAGRTQIPGGRTKSSGGARSGSRTTGGGVRGSGR
jgi:hypothetical protein